MRGAAHVAWRCARCVARHLLRGATPVTWCYTRYVALHPNRTGAMPTDRVYHARRQERAWNLESRNAKEGVLSAPTHKPGPGHKRRHHAGATPVEWRCTRYVALHPLSGAAPVAWCCTRCVALHPLRGAAPEQNGCNAHGSGAMPTDRVYHARRQERARNLESHNTKESGLNTPAQNPGLGNPSGLSTYGWVNDSSSRAQLRRRGRKERGARVGQPF